MNTADDGSKDDQRKIWRIIYVRDCYKVRRREGGLLRGLVSSENRARRNCRMFGVDWPVVRS